MAGDDALESDTTEVVLKGGRANSGQVVRVGDEVARPLYPQTPTVEHFLRFLQTSGITFTPEPRGVDDRGRHRLTYIQGSAPTPPYPQWAFDDDLLVEVAHHQQILHEAARSYVPPEDATWAVSAGAYFPAEAFDGEATLVCHNDLGMPNTIVDPVDRTLVGFIDFDYCRPVDPLFDIAVAARHWVPFGDLDVDDTRDADLDRLRRFTLFCNEHGLDHGQRTRVVMLAMQFLVTARANVWSLAEAGRVGFKELLKNGYEDTNRATVRWLADHAEPLARGS